MFSQRKETSSFWFQLIIVSVLILVCDKGNSLRWLISEELDGTCGGVVQIPFGRLITIY